MDKLKELLNLCKCGVFVTVNEHRDYYESAAQHLEEAKTFECPPVIASDVRASMIERDTIIKVHFYPETPIGSYEIWHHDLDAVLDEALDCFEERSDKV